MIIKDILLNELYPNWNQSDSKSYVRLYLQEPILEVDKNYLFPCVVICPGGGYGFTSNREAEPIALAFAAAGYSAAVVRYSVSKFPTQLCELSLVYTYLRENAKELCINQNKMPICGFSAGGHLAASLSNLWNMPLITKELSWVKLDNKPNAAVLCYPVITSGCFAHRGSFDNLVGDKLKEYDNIVSLEKSVNPNCAKTFIWHTANDSVVPVENSLLYAMALSSHNIFYELHIFPEGPHGISLANHITHKGPEYQNTTVAQWLKLCLDFLDKVL